MNPRAFLRKLQDFDLLGWLRGGSRFFGIAGSKLEKLAPKSPCNRHETNRAKKASARGVKLREIVESVLEVILANFCYAPLFVTYKSNKENRHGTSRISGNVTQIVLPSQHKC